MLCGPSQMKPLKWPLTFALLTLLLPGCNRQRVIMVEMTWECAPDQYKSWAPDAQPVRFKYVADPQYEEVVSGLVRAGRSHESGFRTDHFPLS